ncbi:MAG: hypothetical protein NTY98_02690 [Verrucomicrobia bacterium]|nr:hypothetical protein [Verrucomicrobiota bacterium]
MEDPAAAPQSSPWKGVDFVLPLFLLMPAGDFAAIHGGQAAALHIAGAGPVQLSPLFMVAAGVFTPLLLHRTRLSRWRHGITAALVFLCVLSPVWLLDAGSSAIPLSRKFSHEENTVLRQTFDMPCVFTGHHLRVRRADDTAALRSYLQKLGVLATGPASP